MERNNFSVLVVDDEEVVRQTVGRILTDEGFDVLVAGDGKTAIDLSRTKDIDAALLDIKLPDMTGVDVFEKIQMYRPNVKAVIMTAFEIKDLVKRAFDLGACACLHKPFDIKRLLQILKDIERKNE